MSHELRVKVLRQKFVFMEVVHNNIHLLTLKVFVEGFIKLYCHTLSFFDFLQQFLFEEGSNSKGEEVVHFGFPRSKLSSNLTVWKHLFEQTSYVSTCTEWEVSHHFFDWPQHFCFHDNFICSECLHAKLLPWNTFALFATCGSSAVNNVSFTLSISLLTSLVFTNCSLVGPTTKVIAFLCLSFWEWLIRAPLPILLKSIAFWQTLQEAL